MVIRRETRYVLLGLAAAVVVSAALIVLFIALVSGSGAPSPQPQGAPPASTSAPPLAPQTTAPATPTPATSSSPAVEPLPQGVATQVDMPVGTTPNGFTAGAMIYMSDAPDYTVAVHTPALNRHWGFTYTFSCDPATDDAWRQAYPGHGSFSVRLGDVYLIRGSTYNGSGRIDRTSSGAGVHKLVIDGPCTYELDYYEFP